MRSTYFDEFDRKYIVELKNLLESSSDLIKRNDEDLRKCGYSVKERLDVIKKISMFYEKLCLC